MRYVEGGKYEVRSLKSEDRSWRFEVGDLKLEV